MLFKPVDNFPILLLFLYPLIQHIPRGKPDHADRAQTVFGLIGLDRSLGQWTEISRDWARIYTVSLQSLLQSRDIRVSHANLCHTYVEIIVE